MQKNMIVNNKIAVGLISLTMLASAGPAFAANDNSTNGSPETGIIAALVAKFNLSKTDVESVFKSFHDQERTQMDARHSENMKERLAGAVATGKLTQAQSDAITTKMADVKAQMDVIKNNGKTREENQAQVKTIMSGVRDFAKQNNIPPKYMGMLGGMHRGDIGEGMNGDSNGMKGHGFGNRD